MVVVVEEGLPSGTPFHPLPKTTKLSPIWRWTACFLPLRDGAGGGGGVPSGTPLPSFTEKHKTLADLEVDRKVLKLREVRLPLFIQFRTARRGPLSA